MKFERYLLRVLSVWLLLTSFGTAQAQLPSSEEVFIEDDGQYFPTRIENEETGAQILASCTKLESEKGCKEFKFFMKVKPSHPYGQALNDQAFTLSGIYASYQDAEEIFPDSKRKLVLFPLTKRYYRSPIFKAADGSNSGIGLGLKIGGTVFGVVGLLEMTEFTIAALFATGGSWLVIGPAVVLGGPTIIDAATFLPRAIILGARTANERAANEKSERQFETTLKTMILGNEPSVVKISTKRFDSFYKGIQRIQKKASGK
jgi:hypothetical protein